MVTVLTRGCVNPTYVWFQVTPCVDYFFKVIASEDWKGLREDFKMFSEVIGYKLDYTPKFIRRAHPFPSFLSIKTIGFP